MAQRESLHNPKNSLRRLESLFTTDIPVLSSLQTIKPVQIPNAAVIQNVCMLVDTFECENEAVISGLTTGNPDIQI
ncbi:hypothetical protein SUGI_0904730 [Cryptomeria japonica]|nr:hypothetical protein SUGI_0904730 [Cryptomeria japonica]